MFFLQDHHVIEMFWEVVKSFSLEHQKKFLKYAPSFIITWIYACIIIRLFFMHLIVVIFSLFSCKRGFLFSTLWGYIVSSGGQGLWYSGPSVLILPFLTTYFRDCPYQIIVNLSIFLEKANIATKHEEFVILVSKLAGFIFSSQSSWSVNS